MIFTRRQFIKTGVFVTPALLLLDSLWIEKFFIEVNEYHLKGSSENGANIKLIQISDLHLQSINNQLKRLAKKINQLKPHLILFTGDSIDKAANIPLLNDFLELLHNDIKKAAIVGNWEYWGKVDLNKLRETYIQHNCTLLINETKQYTFDNKTISITGVDDFMGGGADIKIATEKYLKSDYHLILNHCPEYSGIIPEEINREINIDFILSGHTHGGQINIFGYVPFMPQGSGKYLKGWYKDGATDIYVSKGVGTSIFPARFGARAEISIFNLPA